MAETFEKSFEDQLEALAMIDQWQQERNSLLEARAQNNPSNVMKLREAFGRNKNVKSDVKKSSAFVKKIRAINAEGIQQCIRDTDTLNLTQYISEIVDAVLATTYKATELSYVVKLSVSLHQKYEDFTEPLITGLKTILLTVPNEDDAEGAKKKRLNIRFAIELHQQGLLLEDEVFCQLMRNLLGKGKLAQMNAAGRPIVDLQGFSMLVKFGAETLFGFLPKQAKDIAAKAEKTVDDIPSKLLANSKAQGILKTLLNETYDHLCTDLVKAHQDFRAKESKCEKDRLIHGNVTEQKQQEFDNAKRLYERLLSIVTTLSDATGAAVPELKIEKEEEEASGGLAVFDGAGISLAVADEAYASGGVFGDAETKSFYEDLPDLLTLVPLSVLGLSPEQAAAVREEWSKKQQQSDEAPAPSAAELTGAEDTATMADDTLDLPDETDEGPTEADPSTTAAAAAAAAGAPTSDDATSTAGTTTDAEATNASIVANKVDALINNKLPECITKQKCDEFCVSFCYVNSKSARKKLIVALSRLPRFRMELAPFYARIIASLGRLFPDIVEPILEALRREFFGILKARRQVHVDGKVRNVRYQAELVKFRVAPPIVAFRMMRALLLDLTAHHIDMLVAVMETCGRFLFLIPVTHALMQDTLDTMMRLRRARPLDLHQQTLLESAYFAVKPPEKMNKGQKKKELTMVQKYARYLIQEKLEQPRVSVEEVIKHLRRLPWQDEEGEEEVAGKEEEEGKKEKETAGDGEKNQAPVRREHVAYHVMKAVLKVARTKYVALPRVADCLSGLAKYHAAVNVMVVDRIFEELQRALESPFKREIQRILGLARLLGELYNFTAIPAVVIFECLYHVLRFGHEVPVATGGEQQPPSSDMAASTTTIAAAGAGSASASASVGAMFYDPRIPCEADPPTDLFRAQIICELLNTTGVYFVRGAAKEKLNRFLAYFQRYLLTKQMIPMHVEFSILDCFDALDNLAQEAAMDALQKSLLAQQQQQQQVANSKKAKKEIGGRHVAAKKMVAPVVTEWMVRGYQFTRFDTFEAAHRAVEAYEGRAVVVVVPPINGATVADGGCPAAANSSTTVVEEEAASKASGPIDTDGAHAVKDTTTAAAASSSAAKLTRRTGDDDDENSAGGGSLDDDAEVDDSDDDEDDDDIDVDDDEDEDDDLDDEDDDEDDDDDDEDDDDEDSDEDDLDDDDDDDDDEDDEDEEGGMSEDEAARALEKMRIAEEDDEFDRAFKSVLQESRAAVVAKSINVDKMAIPAILPKPKNVYTAALSASASASASSATGDEGASLAAASGASSSESTSMGVAATAAAAAAPPPPPPRNQVAFKLLSRDNKGRIEARQLFVPKEHAIVQHMIKSEEELRIQKERVMERTLLLSAMNAENEEHQAASASNTSDYFFGQREVYQGPTAQTQAGQASGSSLSSSASASAQASSEDHRASGSTSSSSSRVNRSRLGYRSYEESKRAATTLDLDGFLAESNKAEMRRIGNRKNA